MTFAPDAPLTVALAAVVAGAIAAISGFGIGSILTPLLLLSFPAPAAVSLVAIPHVLATVVRWWGLRREVHGPTFRQFGIASAVGGLAGAALQPLLAGTALTLLLGGLLVIAGATEVGRRRVPVPATPFWRLAGGTLSGLFGGLVGNQGGIRSAALLGFELSPRALVATATASALLVDAARLPVYLVASRAVLAANVPLILAASAGALAGTVIGVPLLRHIPERLYRRLLGAFLLLLGITLIAGALASGAAR
ncbi:MAG TPA: sulfite exporter TauE/SafE family protein [Candidatus Eisenbacteria bacterium]|nr:sulfite exporter TauE/SafE family protein [Candidatus Eisenbacteria bacterium]